MQLKKCVLSLTTDGTSTDGVGGRGTGFSTRCKNLNGLAGWFCRTFSSWIACFSTKYNEQMLTYIC